MRDFFDMYFAWFFIFGFPVVCFIIAMLTGCAAEPNYEPICRPSAVGRADAYVVGGTPSQDRRATVKVYLAGGHCSGTVIGPQTVLTAGHCKEPRIVAVEDFGAFEVVEDVVHPGYNGNVRTDLRLLYVENPLPAPFADIASNALVCETLLVQGYGYGSDPNYSLAERRVQAAVRYEEVIITTEGSCNGDSGGPLYGVRADGSYVLVGVTSFGSGEPNVCDGPGGYMNLLVPALGDWVREGIR